MTSMCGRDDDPTQHDVPRLRLYDVTYFLNTPSLRRARVRVWAEDPNDARRKAQALDPDYLVSTDMRIVR